MEKTKVRVTYKLYISGNDLDAKAAQKLKAGDELKLVRLDDETGHIRNFGNHTGGQGA